MTLLFKTTRSACMILESMAPEQSQRLAARRPSGGSGVGISVV
jgi:hypothetical protein